MKERRNKGLCYNCDDKYLSGHRYKVQRLSPRWQQCNRRRYEPRNEGNKDWNRGPKYFWCSGLTRVFPPHHFRNHSARDNDGKKDYSAIILIDTRRTHNFIDPRTTSRARLTVQKWGILQSHGREWGETHQFKLLSPGNTFNTRGFCLQWFLYPKLGRMSGSPGNTLA